MTVVQCRNCFAGNASDASTCHNCRARLSVAPRREATAVRGMVTSPDDAIRDDHMLETALAAQRSREARVARRSLAVAALVCALRATVVPILFAFAPAERFAAFTSPQVTITHYVLAFVFAACYALARRDPLPATVAAAVIYTGVAVGQILDNPTLLGGGHLGKIFIFVLLGRALSAAVMYRVHCGGPPMPDVQKPAVTQPPRAFA